MREEVTLTVITTLDDSSGLHECMIRTAFDEDDFQDKGKHLTGVYDVTIKEIEAHRGIVLTSPEVECQEDQKTITTIGKGFRNSLIELASDHNCGYDISVVKRKGAKVARLN